MSQATDARSTKVLTDRQEFALPVTNLSILTLSLLVHWAVAGSWTFWVAVHFICLGLAAVSSVYLWSTSTDVERKEREIRD